MSQQQPTNNVYPYDPTMEYGPVIESPPNSSKSPGHCNITIVVVVVIIAIAIAIAIGAIISCLWRRRKDRHSKEAEPQFDQEAPPPEPTGINVDEKMLFEDGSTSHGGGGPAPPNFGGGYGSPPPNFGYGYGPPPPNFGRGYGPPPHFGGGYGPPPSYFYG